jgi:hypothetical protein
MGDPAMDGGYRNDHLLRLQNHHSPPASEIASK